MQYLYDYTPREQRWGSPAWGHAQLQQGPVPHPLCISPSSALWLGPVPPAWLLPLAPWLSDRGAELPRGAGDRTAWGEHCVSFPVVFSLTLRSSCESWIGEMCRKHHLRHPRDQQPLLARLDLAAPWHSLGLELALGVAGETGSCPGTRSARVGMRQQTIKSTFFPKPPPTLPSVPAPCSLPCTSATVSHSHTPHSRL